MNTVPKPWVPIEVCENEKGIRIDVWGRTYDFANEIFPVSIKALGEELLHAPIELVGEEFTGKIEWKNKVVWVQEQSEREVVICGSQETDLLLISATTTVSYDGYVNFKFKLCTTGQHPRAGFDVKYNHVKRSLNKLWLEIPLRKAVSILSSYGSFEAGVKSRFTEEDYPEQLNPRILQNGFTQFKPHSWYGNDNVGLGIYFDSDKNWQSEHRETAVERLMEDNHFTIRYHLLDAYPMKWEQEERKLFSYIDIEKTIPYGNDRTPIAYEMGIQATPVKPYDTSFLNEHIIHIDCFDKIYCEYTKFLLETKWGNTEECILDRLKNKGVTTVVLHEAWNKIQGYWRLGVEDSQRIQLLVDEIHAHGMKVLFYFSNGISSLRPVSEDYIERNRYLKRDGQPMVSHYRQPPQRIIRTCANSPDTFKDLTAGMSEFLQKYNGDGVYLDSLDIPWACTNPAHGCGYTDELGVRHATYPMNAMRIALRGIYEEIGGRLGKTIHHHPANAFIPAFHAYCDLVWNGEQLAFRHKTNFQLLFASLDEGFMRTEMVGRNIGVPVQFLAYDLPDGSWNIQKALSVVAPFGVYPRPINVNTHLDFMAGIWKVLDEFNVAECEFKGFFEGAIGVSANHDNVKVSLYTGKNTVMLISNPTDAFIESCKISGDYVAEKELISGEALNGNCFEIRLKPYEVKFVKCK